MADFMKDYRTVADRLAEFTKDYPNGRIYTQVREFVYDPASQRGFVVVEASIWKNLNKGAENWDIEPDSKDSASMPIPGPTAFTKNSEVENASTSAIGRALALIGYLAKNEEGGASIASEEEITAKQDDKPDTATRSQLNKMFAMAKEAGIDTGTADGKKLLQAIVLSATGKRSSKQLTKGDMDKVFTMLSQSKDEYDAALSAEEQKALAVSVPF
jgi:hypothetical protein